LYFLAIAFARADLPAFGRPKINNCKGYFCA